MTVFAFTILHTDKNGKIIDINENQERYVLAATEKEAEKKLDEYRKKMVSEGFCDFIVWPNPTVELENVII